MQTGLPRLALADGLEAQGRFLARIDEVDIPIEFRKGLSDRLVVFFHGASNREKRPVPAFQPMPDRLQGAHMVSISDPTLLWSPVVPAGWYAGSAEIDLQPLIRRLIDDIRAFLGTSRTIYVGASSGGFASLTFSATDPGSVAIAANPQTNLARHYRTPVEKYYNAFWKDRMAFDEFVRLPRFDAASAYRRGAGNTVIYVQSAGDWAHIANHMIPFLAAIERPDQLVLDVGWWGVAGHSGSAPFRTAVMPWLSAVLAAEALDPETLLERRAAERAAEAPAKRAPEAPAKAAPAPGGRSPDFPESELRLTDAVRDALLQASAETGRGRMR